MQTEASLNGSDTTIKTTSSVHDITAEKPPFGSRFLTDEAEVWTRNAWDHVPPPTDQDEIIAASLLKQRSAPVPDEEKRKYNEKPARNWDNFYRTNSSNFFRDRRWLHNEFPELVNAAKPEAGPMTIVEVGCGAGNAVFPLLAANLNPNLTLRAYDYSHHAVKLVENNPLYTSPPIGSIHAAVWDLTSDSLPEGVEPGTVDIISMVFVFSALHPDEWVKAVTNVHKMLKPGGLVMFRDYGRYDMAQLRFKGGRLLDDNFYARGDKTRVYFFELDELALLFTGVRARSAQPPNVVTEVVEDDSEDGPLASTSRPLSPDPASGEMWSSSVTANPEPAHIHPSLLSSPPKSLFTAEQLGIDRRLLVNRKRQVKMYRVWMQGKFRKLVDSNTS
ncbi:S-adenosyl-L-methionine-dependent methyltransferase [Mycena sp. CBHHK59/15]|nr:S-adenosyl-L-methionine-dependent methyltransferase [Mycena sp. CBHHK59/15]